MWKKKNSSQQIVFNKWIVSNIAMHTYSHQSKPKPQRDQKKAFSINHSGESRERADPCAAVQSRAAQFSRNAVCCLLQNWSAPVYKTWFPRTRVIPTSFALENNNHSAGAVQSDTSSFSLCLSPHPLASARSTQKPLGYIIQRLITSWRGRAGGRGAHTLAE